VSAFSLRLGSSRSQCESEQLCRANTQPFLALGVVWPLFWESCAPDANGRKLLPAAAVSFLILSHRGLLESGSGMEHATPTGFTIGSFPSHKARFPQAHRLGRGPGVLGAGQLRDRIRDRSSLPAAVPPTARIACAGRPIEQAGGARRASLGPSRDLRLCRFLVLMIRLPVWSTYIEIINDSRIVREFVLKNDVGRINRPRRAIKLSKEKCGCTSSAIAGGCLVRDEC